MPIDAKRLLTTGIQSGDGELFLIIV